jgi:hypothetical protein
METSGLVLLYRITTARLVPVTDRRSLPSSLQQSSHLKTTVKAACVGQLSPLLRGQNGQDICRGIFILQMNDSVVEVVVPPRPPLIVTAAMAKGETNSVFSLGILILKPVVT